MHIVLIRDLYARYETLGTMLVGTQRFYTLERPWVAGDDPGEDGGEPGKSCVPEGTYALELHNTPKHPECFALVNTQLDVAHYPTPGMRSAVLIHAANWAFQLEGCIALGLGRIIDRNHVGADWMNTSSRAAIAEFKRLVPWETGHTLEIQRSPNADLAA